MEKEYIAVLDSGIGGISALKKLQETYPMENFIYFGDGINAPYGNKTNRELIKIVCNNLDEIKKYPIKALVLGCNTLSVNLRAEIEDYSKIKTFGVYPPVERALIENKRVLLLSTIRTAEKYYGIKNLDVVGLKTLAYNIEYNMFNLNKINFSNELKSSLGVFNDCKGYYDAVILGCTHYFFIKNDIKIHFCPPRLYDGVDYMVEKVGRELKLQKTLVKHNRNAVLFLGSLSNCYKKFYSKCG